MRVRGSLDPVSCADDHWCHSYCEWCRLHHGTAWAGRLERGQLWGTGCEHDCFCDLYKHVFGAESPSVPEVVTLRRKSPDNSAHNPTYNPTYYNSAYHAAHDSADYSPDEATAYSEVDAELDSYLDSNWEG